MCTEMSAGKSGYETKCKEFGARHKLSAVGVSKSGSSSGTATDSSGAAPAAGGRMETSALLPAGQRRYFPEGCKVNLAAECSQ